MKKIFCLLLGVLLLFCACGPGEPVQSEEPSVEEPSESLPYDGPENPLTGLPTSEDLSGRRPYAIVLNNLKVATPQHGISKADIVYEVLAEGGITRMIALYQDVNNVGVIGSVRSARSYFLDIAQSHDAIFIHAGGSEQAYSDISSRKINNIDGVRGSGVMFYRDAARKSSKGYEHSLMTSTELIQKHIASYKFRMEHGDYTYKMAFADDGTPEAGEAAANVNVRFSSEKTGVFTYDETDGLYHVNQYGGALTDGNTGEQLAVTNVLVLFAKNYGIAGDDKGRIVVELSTTGKGYYACGGSYIPIKWQKSSAGGQFVYTLEDGTPLTLGRGTSYVNIVPLDAVVTMS